MKITASLAASAKWLAALGLTAAPIARPAAEVGPVEATLPKHPAHTSHTWEWDSDLARRFFIKPDPLASCDIHELRLIWQHGPNRNWRLALYRLRLFIAQNYRSVIDILRQRRGQNKLAVPALESHPLPGAPEGPGKVAGVGQRLGDVEAQDCGVAVGKPSRPFGRVHFCYRPDGPESGRDD